MNLLLELSKKLKDFKDQKHLLAISGGLDSMALLCAFEHLREHFSFQFAVAHFHHGPSVSQTQLHYRRQARQFVKDQCQKKAIDFYCNWHEQEEEVFLGSFAVPLSSEADFRDARYAYFESLLQVHAFDSIVLAHHSDDLLESRLLKLIRGVGPDSFEAMHFFKNKRLRPLLSWSRQELKELNQIREVEWLEDPSNESIEPMRNWLRQVWLKELEDRYPGSCRSLGRSLDLLVHRPETELQFSQYFNQKGLDLSLLVTLSLDEKKRVIAYYMRGQGLKNYGQSHINEVLKRLDMEQKRHTFQLLGRRWIVDAGRMSVEDRP